MASVNWFAARKCWRVAYNLYIRGRRVKKAKYLKNKPAARRLVDQLEVLEMIADNPARKVNPKEVQIRLHGSSKERRIVTEAEIRQLL